MAPDIISNRCANPHCRRTACGDGGCGQALIVVANEAPKRAHMNMLDFPDGWRKPRKGKHANQRR